MLLSSKPSTWTVAVRWCVSASSPCVISLQTVIVNNQPPSSQPLSPRRHFRWLHPRARHHQRILQRLVVIVFPAPAVREPELHPRAPLHNIQRQKVGASVCQLAAI